jgi:hypothetical protein
LRQLPSISTKLFLEWPTGFLRLDDYMHLPTVQFQIGDAFLRSLLKVQGPAIGGRLSICSDCLKESPTKTL